MIRRTGTQFLVGNNPYQVIDGTGAITNTYQDHEWDAQEDFGRVTYHLRDGRLIEHSEVTSWYEVVVDEDKVLLEGLVEDRSDETARFVAVALGDREVAEEERRLRVQRESEERVEAIEGAREPFAEALYEQARKALIERVYRWHDERSGELLRTLIELVRAEVPRPALRAYAIGCLRACFEPAHEIEEGGVVASPFAGRVRELADLVKLAGDGQDEIDAPSNARELWAAAEALSACARMLGG